MWGGDPCGRPSWVHKGTTIPEPTMGDYKHPVSKAPLEGCPHATPATAYRLLSRCALGFGHAELYHSAPGPWKSCRKLDGPAERESLAPGTARVGDCIRYQSRPIMVAVSPVPQQPVAWEPGSLDHLFSHARLCCNQPGDTLDADAGGYLARHQFRAGDADWRACGMAA